MVQEFQKHDVVQFNENHKWCGSLGIIIKVKALEDDTKYMVAVPIPEKGIAYIFVLESENAIEYIGRAVLTDSEGEDDE